MLSSVNLCNNITVDGYQRLDTYTICVLRLEANLED